MASWTSSVTKPKTVSSNVQMSDKLATIARKRAIWSKTVKNSKRKKKKIFANKANQPRKKLILSVELNCGKKNHPEERCWQGAGAHLKPKRTRSEDPSDNKLDSKAPKLHPKPPSSNSQPSSKNDDSKN